MAGPCVGNIFSSIRFHCVVRFYICAPFRRRPFRMTAPISPTTAPDTRCARLIADAAKVFWTYGIKSVTMDDLATRLGISKKTLYQCVKDKNDLVGQVLQCMARESTCEVTHGLDRETNAIDELFAIANRVSKRLRDIHPSIHFDLEKYHPEAFHAWRQGKRAEIFASMVANLQRGIKEGLYRKDLDVHVITTLHIARFDLVFNGELFPPDQFNLEEVQREMFRYHIRGIASPKGVEYLVKKVKREMGNRSKRAADRVK
jgi:AcrR family transcriptional regulator